MSKFLVNLLRWVVILAMPLFLVLTTARLMVADWYPRYEYAKPSFPPDRYGFTSAQRLDLSLVAIHYLNRSEPAPQVIGMLEAQRLPGTDKPLYAPAEISHMLDVKRVMDQLWRLDFIAGGLFLASLIILLVRPSTRIVGYNALLGGGIFTAMLLMALAVFVLTAFDTFFITFHEVLFPAGTWTFDWSDSLIRLFPEMFWSDAGTMIVVGTLLEGVIVAVVGRILARRWRFDGRE